MEERDNDLLKTIHKWIDSNGGRNILTDIIISENHEIYESEAVEADKRLKLRGITSYEDIKPVKSGKVKKLSRPRNYRYNAILIMYPHYSYKQLAEELGIRVSCLIQSANILINKGLMKRKGTLNAKWTPSEDEFIIKNAPVMNNSELSISMNRSESAISSRKTKLGVKLSSINKKPAGALAFKIKQYEKKGNDTTIMV